MRSPQLYVYYRVRHEHRDAVVAAVRALHAQRMHADPALRCELMERVESAAPDRLTLMEVYRREGGLPAAERQRFEREAGAALAAWLDGPRHVEVFAPCA